LAVGDSRSIARGERGSMMTIALMSVAGIVVMAVVAQKFTSTGLGSMMKSRTSSNEVSAIASLRVINSAQASYSSGCTSGGFAVTLEDLAKVPPNQSAPFISSDLGKNGIEKNGYKLTLDKDGRPGVRDMGTASDTCNNATTNPASSYFASAEPTVPGSSGVRFFATDARGIIFSSSEPIDNPIVESDTVKPVQGGDSLEKLSNSLTQKDGQKDSEKDTDAQ
jgi:hypothetical protein